MCFWFAVIGFIAVRGFFPTPGDPRTKGRVVASALMLAMVTFCIGGQVWFQRRTISEISFDGRGLRLRTLGTKQMETLDLSEIAEVRDWIGRGNALGYRLKFRDGRKYYLGYSVSNCAAIAAEIRYSLDYMFV
jgi:hypothetical protein